jgi:hypothetical protein
VSDPGPHEVIDHISFTDVESTNLGYALYLTHTYGGHPSQLPECPQCMRTPVVPIDQFNETDKE